MPNYIWFPFSPLYRAASHDAQLEWQIGHWNNHGRRALLERLWIGHLRLSSSFPHPGCWPSCHRRHRRCAPSLPHPYTTSLPFRLFFTPLLFPVHKMMSGRGRGSPKGIARFIDCHLRQVLIEMARAYERDGDIGLHFLQVIENADFWRLLLRESKFDH